MKTIDTLDQFTRSYITTALWSSNDYKYSQCPCCGRMAILDRFPEIEFEEEAMCSADGCGTREIANPDPMDANYSADDLAGPTLAKMELDCSKFQEQCEIDLRLANEAGRDASQCGHDFWLTRCGHGAGFWDGDYPDDVGERLTAASESFGNVELYVGDDGKIYC